MTCVSSHTLHYSTSCDVYCMLLYCTIDVLTVVHPGNVIRWAWSWIECVSSIDAGMCKYDWWYDDTCAVMITCSSCIDLLFTHMTGENGPAGWILYLVMLCVHVLYLIRILLLCIFFQYFQHYLPTCWVYHLDDTKNTSCSASCPCLPYEVCPVWRYINVDQLSSSLLDNETESFLCFFFLYCFPLFDVLHAYMFDEKRGTS